MRERAWRKAGLEIDFMSVSIFRCGGVTLIAVLMAALLGACALNMACNAEAAWAASDAGWQIKQGHKYYYKNGEKLTGMQKIGKSYYYFNAKGVMQSGKTKADGVVYYLGDTGKMEAYKTGGAFFKPTGKQMKAYQAKEYQALLHARAQVTKITKKRMTKAQKLLACFKWVQKGYYHEYRRFRNYKGWAADFANDHFVRKWHGLRHGCCNSDAAAFGYLALALGYKDVYVGVDSTSGTSGHGCTKIKGKYYDPLFAEAKSFSRYYGTRNGGYHFRSVKLLVPSSSNKWNTSKYYGQKPASSAGGSKVYAKSRLIKLKGSYYYYENYKRVKKQWRTVKRARYYFQKNGKAACGPAKVKGKWYVFATNGKLKTGKTTRIVKVDGEKYRVTKRGVAKAGWSTNMKNLFLVNGRMATGLSLYKNQVYWMSDTGVYDTAKTQAIRAAAQKEANASSLLALIGAPKKTAISAGCLPVIDAAGNEIWGNDVIYTYKNCEVELMQGDNGITYFRGFRAKMR